MRKKRALILNRRCIRNPQKGGAEVYTHYMAKALTAVGCNVTWFCSRPEGLAKREKLDDIEFMRHGNELTVHIFGFLYALLHKYDLVIDEFNGIGFFTFFIKKPKVLLIHQLYKEFWNAEFGAAGYIFRAFELFLLQLYRKYPVVTVSKSTKDCLMKLGFRNISIVHNGLDVEPMKKVEKRFDKLRLLFLGRLRKTKNPEDAIKSFLQIKKRYSNCELRVIGDGPELGRLKQKYAKQVIFEGYVDNSKKYELLRNAHFILVPSLREGWGQVVIQANAMGTPAIGYNVAGLKDSIRHGNTGFLVRDYKEMAEVAVDVFARRVFYLEICKNAVEYSKEFNWEASKRRFIKSLKSAGLL